MRNREVFKWNCPPCHNGPIEVIPNLFCGSLEESAQMVSLPFSADMLVPLDSLDATIWKRGFRGEILYYPIEDYGVLPDEVLTMLISKILRRLKSGKKVGVFCLGGHGRTGYIASIVLGKLGYEDPVDFLREHYCKKAIESNEQIQHIAEVLDKPELLNKYAIDDLYSGFYNRIGFEPAPFMESTESPVCKNCIQFQEGVCRAYWSFIEEDELACDLFEERLYK